MNINRLLFLIIIVIVGFFVIVFKLFFIQVVNSEELRFFAQQQQTELEKIKAERGSIYDRDNTLLVYNTNDVSFFVDVPLARKYKSLNKIAEKFSEIFDHSTDYYLDMMQKSRRRTVCIEEKVDASIALELKKLTIEGLYFQEDPTRVYQYGTFASHILGYTNSNYQGLDGIEIAFDKKLKGTDGSRVILKDAVGGMITVIDESAEGTTPGDDIILTIKKQTQSILEQELRKGLRQAGGDYAVGIIMDPHTGEIIAMANYRNFDPNKYFKYSDRVRRNKTIADIYEPGSTIKAVIMASFLDQNICTMNEKIYLENGRYQFKNIVVRDSHLEEEVTVKDAFAMSSNIGMAKLVQRIDDKVLYKYLRAFGFGNYTFVGLPLEVKGILKKPTEWSQVTKVSMSYGYEIAVTPLQLITAYSAVINGGILYEPRIVKEIRSHNGSSLESFEPKIIRRVISEKTSVKMRDLMRRVVERGTGGNAQVKGISTAGKTGTARQLINGEYSTTYYNASFVGFFPADEPEYVCLIMVHSPNSKRYYGGEVAAPIFRGIVEKMLYYDPEIRALRDDDLLEEDLFFADNEEENKTEIKHVSSFKPLLNLSDNNRMPDLKGRNIREAVAALTKLEVDFTLSGTGRIVYQSVAPGTEIKPGMKCKIKGREVQKLEAVLY